MNNPIRLIRRDESIEELPLIDSKDLFARAKVRGSDDKTRQAPSQAQEVKVKGEDLLLERLHRKINRDKKAKVRGFNRLHLMRKDWNNLSVIESWNEINSKLTKIKERLRDNSYSDMKKSSVKRVTNAKRKQDIPQAIRKKHKADNSFKLVKIELHNAFTHPKPYQPTANSGHKHLNASTEPHNSVHKPMSLSYKKQIKQSQKTFLPYSP